MGLCSKPPDLRSVGVIALNTSLHKSKLEQSQYVLRYRINYTCNLIIPSYVGTTLSLGPILTNELI